MTATDKLIDKLAWLLIENKKVLFVRTKGKEVFYTAGGKRNGVETDEEALCREVKEELDVTLLFSSIKHVITFDGLAEGKINTRIKLACYFAQYVGKLKPSSEIEEMAWIDSGNISTHKLSDNGKRVIALLKSENLIN